ncbi:universal stress protein [Oceanibium sediminis]|uniref:universal stress protein n=1 Tax=Oceanibium sediminis TaxID=2026339 RepID=UPI00130094B9|nr:universal stress protein [Oceanibium sediminis]
MYKNILIPVDILHPEVAEKILARAKALADSGARITAVHAVTSIPTYAETYVPVDIRKNREKAQHEELEKFLEKAGLDAEALIVTGAPHIAILEVIDDMKPDLVIIGSHQPGLADYFLGSTAARVVRHAKCSVLVER